MSGDGTWGVEVDGIAERCAPSTATSYTYDANGSTITVAAPAGKTHYLWDLRNRMVGIDLPVSGDANGDGDGDAADANETAYAYDHNGVRISQTAGQATTYYLNDAANPTGYTKAIEERVDTDSDDKADATVRTFTFGLTVLSQTDAAATPIYLITDGHGSTRLVTNAAGATLESYDYTAFGQPIGFIASQALTDWQFGGDGIYDGATGWTYHLARWRSDFRFVSYDSFEADPASPAGLHKYVYASANPVHSVDPSGCVTMAEGRAIHAAIETMYGTAHLGNTWFPEAPIPTSFGLLRPDITDYTLGEVAEIKPLTPYGLATGPAQLAAYLSALNGLVVNWRGKTYTLPAPTPHFAGAKPWTPSSWAVGVQQVLVPTMPTTFVLTVGNAGGVIYYITLDPLKYTLAAAMALAKEMAAQINACKGLLQDGDGAVAEAARRQIEFSLQFSISQHTLSTLAVHAAAATTVGLLAMVGIAMLNSALAPAAV